MHEINDLTAKPPTERNELEKELPKRQSLTNITNSIDANGVIIIKKPGRGRPRKVLNEEKPKVIDGGGIDPNVGTSSKIHQEIEPSGKEDDCFDRKLHAINMRSLRTKIDASTKDFDLPESIRKMTNSSIKTLLNNSIKYKDTQILWLKVSPIYVVDARQKSIVVQRDMFPKRIRSKFCYLCGLCSGEVLKCSAAGCPTRFHQSCAEKSTLGGYTFNFMKRRALRQQGHHGPEQGVGVFCSRHHCQACFADHNRSRCFYGSFVSCDQCELSWHRDCIPGGCTIDEKDELTCPRHVAFTVSPSLSLQHCAACQQLPQPNESLVKCTNCLRSVHFNNCYNEVKLKKVVGDTEEERSTATCHWCDSFDFLRLDEYAMARFSRQWWYPCQVVKNEEFPGKSPFLGSVGYLCVKWLPYKGKIFYNLIPHNRIVAMSDHDFFFVNEAHKTDIFDEWVEAQKFMVKYFNPQNKLPNKDQVPDQTMSNGQMMAKKIQRNRYSSADLKTNRERLQVPDFCDCGAFATDRCGPNSNCINRTLRQECPKGCGEDTKMGCANRRISEGQNCIKVEIKYFPGKGYGALALENVPTGGFVGEYVGEVISLQERKRRIDRINSMNSHEAQYYIMELDDRRAIDAQFYGNDMRYVNHSCDPNCMIQQIQSDFDKHLVLIAKRDIHKGDELSFDYNFVCGEGRSVPICHCGAKNCTGVLSAGKDVKQTMYDWESDRKLSSKSNIKARRISSIPTSTRKGPKIASAPFSSSAPARRKCDDDAKSKTAAKRAKTPAKSAKTGLS